MSMMLLQEAHGLRPVGLARLLLLPVTLDDPNRPDLDAQRVTAQLRHQREPIHLSRRADVLIIPQAAQLGPSLTDLQRSQQNLAVVLETVPRQARRVVQPHLAYLAQEIDQGARQQGVLQADTALGAGAD